MTYHVTERSHDVKKISIGCALLVALAIPAGAVAAPQGGDARAAAKQCKAERAAMGADVFRQTYRNLGQCVQQKARERATQRRQALRDCRAQGLRGRELAACVRQAARDQAAEQQDELNAARACRAELEQLGEDAFRDKYGTNRNKRNAFGKCVEAHAGGDDDAGQQDDGADHETGDQQEQSSGPESGQPNGPGDHGQGDQPHL
jgi:hypothetical protein